MLNSIQSLTALPGGNGFQAVFADGSIKDYSELIAVDFDGEANASYTNDALGVAIDGIAVKATVDADAQSAILAKLNGEAADGVLYVDAAQAAALPNASYSTIYVGDTDAFAAYGTFAGLAETTGAAAAATKGDNAFVFTGADFDADALAATIAHEAGHLMGTVEHDYGMDGLTLDDFGTAFSERVEQKDNSSQNTSYTGTLQNLSYSSLNGGAVRYAAGTMKIGQSGETTLLNNNRGQWGGAISVENDHLVATCKLTLQYTTLSNNRSGYAGGAVNLSKAVSSSNVIAAIDHCTFTANTAGLGDKYAVGGAVFAHESSVKFTVANSTFTNNKAASGGGAIALVYASGSVTDSTFTGNQGAILLSNTLLEGTASDTTSITVKGCSFTTANDTITVTNGTLTFSGTNTFAASVTSAATITGAANATYVFNPTSAISFTLSSIGGNSAVKFDDAKASTGFSGARAFASTEINTKTGTVGDFTQIASGVNWLAADASTVTLNGKAGTVVGSSSAAESGVYVSSSGNLNVKTSFYGRAIYENSATDAVAFKSGEYSEGFGTATLGGNKTVTGQGTGTTFLDGRIYADGKALSISNLDYKGRIYGDNAYDAAASAKATSVTLDGVKIESNGSTSSRIYGGADITAAGTAVTSSANIALTIDLADGSTVGNVYGGGCLSQTGCQYTIGTITTTLSGDGAYYRYYVGNGTQANTGCLVNQGKSTLTISGGTFASYVYAGGYSQVASSGSEAQVVCAATELNISGGTFNSNVLGGCAASGSVAYATNTYVTGDCVVNISGGVFNGNLIAASSGKGKIGGSTYMTFTSDSVQFGANSYVYGGSAEDKSTQADHKGCVSGDNTRNLTFDGYNGAFNANIRNSFDTISFKGGATVTFGAQKEVDLRFVKTWSFDISDDVTDLTWTGADCDDPENDFTGDTLKLTAADYDGAEKILMSGSETTLNNWSAIGAIDLTIGDTAIHLTNAGEIDDTGAFKFSDGTHNYKLAVDGSNNLKFSAVLA